MASIQIFTSLQYLFNNQTEIELDVANLQQLLTRLPQAYPQCAQEVANGISVAIDGRIVNDAWFTPIEPNSEVVILPRISGG